MKADKVFRVNTEFSKDDFLREALRELATNEDTPTDIFDSNFSEVLLNEVQVVALTADVHTDYSCMVGTDRKEEYWDKEERWVEGGKRYVDVKKTRTVTDWSPYSGSKDCRVFSCAENADEKTILKNEKLFAYAEMAFSDCKQENVVDGDIDFEINEEAYDYAVLSAKAMCEHSVSLPGDRQKDKKFNTSANVVSSDGLIMPAYTLDYVYKGVTFKAQGFGCGKINVKATTPGESSSNSKQAKRKMLPFMITAICCAVIAVILGVLDAGGMEGVGGWMVLPMLVAIGLGIGCYYIYCAFKKSIIANKEKIKLERLQEVLKKYNLNSSGKQDSVNKLG